LERLPRFFAPVEALHTHAHRRAMGQLKVVCVCVCLCVSVCVCEYMRAVVLCKESCDVVARDTQGCVIRKVARTIYIYALYMTVIHMISCPKYRMHTGCAWIWSTVFIWERTAGWCCRSNCTSGIEHELTLAPPSQIGRKHQRRHAHSSRNCKL